MEQRLRPYQIERPLGRKAVEDIRRSLFQDAFREELEDPKPYVMLYAWRFARFIATGLNLINNNEQLRTYQVEEWDRPGSYNASTSLPMVIRTSSVGMVPAAGEEEEFMEAFHAVAKALSFEEGSENHPYMGKAVMRHYADQDTFTAKGTIVARLEDIAERAAKEGDIRAELAAVKTLAGIHGVSRGTGGRTTNQDFIDAVAHVSDLEGKDEYDEDEIERTLETIEQEIE
jgi:hypothetical protein